MAPLVELLVVRDGQETADAVEAEMEKFTSCRELPKQEGFRFYYLTDPVRGVAYLPESGIQTYQNWQKICRCYMIVSKHLYRIRQVWRSKRKAIVIVWIYFF